MERVVTSVFTVLCILCVWTPAIQGDADPASTADRTSSSSSSASQNPRIVEHPKDEWFQRNQPGTLICKAEGNPPPEITWYQNGELVVDDKEPYHRSVLVNGNLFFLRFLLKNKESDVGTYYCKAKNIHGEALSRNVSINLAVLRNDFRQEPVSTAVGIGKTAILHCKPPNGEPDAQVSWEHNGKKVHPDNGVQIHSDGDLVIITATKDDAGDYVCIASNPGGEKKSSVATLSVQDVPVITRLPDDVTADEGETVEFHCKVSGDPNVKWGWQKLGGTINPHRSHVLPDHRLRIEDIDISDEGEYVCRVENAVGTVEAVAHLKVQYTPTFLIRPQNQVVARGRTVTMKCAATGNPVPTIYWKTQSQQMLLFESKEKGRFSVAQDGTLRIERVQKSDEGEYVCTALNLKGEATASAVISVKDNDDRPPPVIQYGPQNQTLPQDGDALLRCIAIGEPMPSVAWFKDQRPLQMADARYALLNSGTLQISSLKTTDTGLYTCKAVSETGETTWNAQLTVQSQYHNPSFPLRPPSDISSFPSAPNKPVVSDVTESSIKLSWEVPHKPGSLPVTRYQVEYFGYGSTETWVVAGSSYMEAEVMIDGLRPNTTYVFLVRSRNTHGFSGPSPWSDLIRTLDAGQGYHSVGPSINLPRAEAEARLRNIRLNLTSAETLNSSAIRISWRVSNDVGVVDGFYIQYKLILSMDAEHQEYGPTFTRRVPYRPLWYIINGLDSYRYYQICVKASSGESVSACSKPMKQHTGESVPTGPPLNIVMHREGETKMLIEWSPPSVEQRKGQIQGYVIKCYSEDNGQNCSLSTNGSTLSVQIDQLMTGHNYHVQVAAVTSKGVGVWSRVITAGQEKSDITKEPWFIGMLIGIVAGSLWLVLCIFTIWLCRKRKQRKKLKGEWYSGGARANDKQPERNGNVFRNGYGIKDSTFQSGTEPGLPPEFTTLLAQSRKEEGNEENMYNMARDCNLPEMKTFYQKSSPVTPYATTTLLQAQAQAQAQNARQQQGGSDQTFRPITQMCPQHSSGSADSNTDRSNTTDENGMLIKQKKSVRPNIPQAKPPVNWSDVLPPPPDHPPSDSEVHPEDQLYSEIQENRPRSPISPVSIAQLSACSCPVSHSHQTPGYNMANYSDSDCNRCQSAKHYDQGPYSPQQFLQQMTPAQRQHILQNMSRTLSHHQQPQHSNSPRGTPVYLHGYSQPWDCTQHTRMPYDYDYAQVPREEAYTYSQPLGEGGHSQHPLQQGYHPLPRDDRSYPHPSQRGGPGDYCEGPCRDQGQDQGLGHSYGQGQGQSQIDSINSYNRSRSEMDDSSSIPYLQSYKIDSPPNSEYRVVGGSSHSGSGGESVLSGRQAGLKGRSSSEGSDLKDKQYKRTHPNSNIQSAHPSLYQSRSEVSPPGHCMVEEGYTRSADSPISEDPDYAEEESEAGGDHDNGRDSMVANWESMEDCSSDHSSVSNCAEEEEEGGQFLNEEDFASAVAQAAVMSGLTVVGTTVSDPSPKQAKKTRRHHRQVRRPPSPGYSTDSNYGTADMVHKPYPKSHRKKQLIEQGKKTLPTKGDNSVVPQSSGGDILNDKNAPAYSKPQFPSSPTSPTNHKSSPFSRRPEGSTMERKSGTTNAKVGMFQFGEDIPVV